MNTERKHLQLFDEFHQSKVATPIVVIGSGLAGYMFVKEFRKLDSKTAIEMITLDDGAFYSKPLLSTALTQKKSAENLAIFPAKKMAEDLAIKIHTYATVESIDVMTRTIVWQREGKKETLEFSRLILACGAQVALPPVSGSEPSDFSSVNTLEDYRIFRHWLEDKHSIAIMGAGLVGCEFANDLVNAEFSVKVIAPEAHPLSKLVPPFVSEQLKQSLEAKGVAWHLQTTIQEIHRLKKGYDIILSNGETIFADGIFAATGIKPRLGLAQHIGLETRQGIVVNRWLQTSIPYIFALGDCAEVDGHLKQYVAPLLQCAQTLAKILTGSKEPLHYPAMPIVIKTPACPLVVSPPSPHIHGEWHVEGEGISLRALFHDKAGQLHGFALVGEKVRDKMELAKQLPLIFQE
jgi:rubredoxin-NAD+ reductase